MAAFSPWITPLNQSWQEVSPTGWITLYEGIPAHIDCLGPLLYELFQEHWAEIQVGCVAEGGVLEAAFTSPPALCVLYDGYLTVATETWHLHLCLEEHRGGPYGRTPLELRCKRLVSRAALYRRLNPQRQPRQWGIQFWNGAEESLLQIFLPSQTTCPKAKPTTKSSPSMNVCEPFMSREKSGSLTKITLSSGPTWRFAAPAAAILPATIHRLWKPCNLPCRKRI
jgi:hypothetical protein